jgi:hypothetical protein
MSFGPAKSAELNYDPSHSRVGSVGDLGEQCGASDRGQKQLEIFQSVLKIQMHGHPLRRWYSAREDY